MPATVYTVPRCEIDAVIFEVRNHVLPHLVPIDLGVGIVAALAVGWMVPVGDDPVLRRVGKVGLEPGQHCAAGGPGDVGGVQDDEVDIGVVERVVGFRTRSEAPCFTACGEREVFIEGSALGRRVGVGGVVIAECRPEYGPAQQAGVHVEELALILGIRPRAL